MKIFNWFKRAIKNDQCVETLTFNIVCIRMPDGVSAESGFAIRNILNFSNPDDWKFLNPSMFLVFFKSESSGQTKSDELVANICKYSKSHIESGIKIAAAKGLLTVGYDNHGAANFGPVGLAINEVMNQVSRV